MHGIIQCLTVGPIQLLSQSTKELHGLSVLQFTQFTLHGADSIATFS